MNTPCVFPVTLLSFTPAEYEILSTILVGVLLLAFSTALLYADWYHLRRFKRVPIDSSERGVIGYKIFDSKWKCRGLQYIRGERISMTSLPELCRRGFHFCLNANDCRSYYTTDLTVNNKFAIVEAVGALEFDGYKAATNALKINKELSRQEFLKLCETDQVYVPFRFKERAAYGEVVGTDWLLTKREVDKLKQLKE